MVLQIKFLILSNNCGGFLNVACSDCSIKVCDWLYQSILILYGFIVVRVGERGHAPSCPLDPFEFYNMSIVRTSE